MRFRLLLFLLLIQAVAIAQPYYFKHFLADDGLAHNTVSSLLQTKNGIIWVGTKSGLNSYNGYTFKTHLNRANKFGTIGNNFILSLAEDKNGMIWVATGRGVFRYNPVYETFKEIALSKIEATFNIKVDKENNIWWLKSDVLVRYNQQNNRITIFPNLKGYSFDFDKEGNIWLGTADGNVLKFNPETNTTTKIVTLINPNLLKNTRVISKVIIDGDRLLAGTEKQGLIAYSLQDGKTKQLLPNNYSQNDIYVRDILPIDQTKYWVGTESGIYICDFNDSKITNLRKKQDNRFAISDNAVYCLLKDNQNGLWAGTFFGGLNFHSPESSKFKKYININGENSISGNAVREISSSDGKQIWIGTEDGGLNRFNVEKESFHHYLADGKPNSLSYPNVHGLAVSQNKVYIGPFLHGLDVLDLATNQIVEKHPIVADKNGAGSDFVMSIYEAKNGRIFLGMIRGGLFEYLPKSKKLQRIDFIGKDASIFSVVEDHAGVLWTGTLQNGLYYLNLKTGKGGNIRLNSDKNDVDYQVQGIFEDSKHNLWMASEGGGLIKLDANRKDITKYTTENGLPSNYTYRVLEDDQHRLWISSLKGLILLNPADNTIKVFNRSNGLQTDQFNYNSAYKAPNGIMYFGTVQGLVSFNPKDITKSTTAPPMAITNLQVNNEETNPGSGILNKSISYIDTLTLNYDQANFSLDFSALSYGLAKTISYKYLMEGLEQKKWTVVNNSQRAYFTNLAPGTYRFLVYGESETGNWKTKTKELFIKIRPPFWKSQLAYAFYLALIIFSILLIAHLYKKRLEQKNLQRLQLFEFEKNKEIYQAKIEFFTNIAHEIQTPLTLIRGPVERLLDKVEEYPTAKKSLDLINKYTNRLLSLTSQLLDFRKTEIDQFGLNFVEANINQILKQQVDLFKPQALNRNLKIEVSLPQQKLNAYVDLEAFNKIVSNLLSNAVKYAKTAITISLQLAGENFMISVENDGADIEDDAQIKIFEPFYRMKRDMTLPGTGIGLAIARSLAELHNGTLILHTAKANRIIFELKLPLRHNVEFKLSSWKKI